jgi:hypothetical protein
MFDLLWAQVFAAFATALVGGLHCAGMCGGFVGALQLHRPRAVPAATLAIGYHGGRITSYATVGALVGLCGEYGRRPATASEARRLLSLPPAA